MDDPNRSVETYLERVAPEKRQKRRGGATRADDSGDGRDPAIVGQRDRLRPISLQVRERSRRRRSGSRLAPRKSATVIHLADGTGGREEQLRQLGPHTTGVGCLYIGDLDKIDISVLESIVVESYGTVTADTYTLRARERAAE
jgi:hypothetical protein